MDYNAPVYMFTYVYWMQVRLSIKLTTGHCLQGYIYSDAPLLIVCTMILVSDATGIHKIEKCNSNYFYYLQWCTPR